MGAKKAFDLADRVEEMAEDLDDEVEDELEGGARATKVQAQREIQVNDSVAHGNLIASFITDDSLLDLPRGEVGVSVAATMPYSAFVEYGTGIYNTSTDPTKDYKAGDGVPIGPIRQWVIRKGLTPNEPIEFAQSEVPDPSMMHIKEQEKLAWRIRAVVEKYGNKPHPFMRPAYRKRRDPIVRAVTDTVDDVYSW